MSVSENRTKNEMKKILKNFPQYKRVNDIDNADLAIIFTAADIKNFYIIAIESYDKEKLKNGTNEKVKIFYLKHKNPRNRKQLVDNDVGKNHFMFGPKHLMFQG